MRLLVVDDFAAAHFMMYDEYGSVHFLNYEQYLARIAASYWCVDRNVEQLAREALRPVRTVMTYPHAIPGGLPFEVTQLAAQREMLGGCLRLHVRPADGCVHGLLDRISPVHASELTHISLQTFTDREAAAHYESTRNGGRRTYEGGIGMGNEHGAQFTALRVLEILYASDGSHPVRMETDVLSHRSLSRWFLVQSTLATLRTLALIDVTGDMNVHTELTPLLRAAGPHLHYLSVCALGCQPTSSFENAPGIRREGWPGEFGGLCYLQLHGPLLTHLAFDGQDDDDEDDGFDLAELESDMLRNAVEGLCISLREPARIVTHLHGNPRDSDVVAGWLNQVQRSLAEPRWLR